MNSVIRLRIEKLQKISEVSFHVGFDILRRRTGFEVGEAIVADVLHGLQHAGYVNLTFPEIPRVVLEMHLADTLLAEPTNLADRIETLVSRVADVVVSEHR